MIVQRKALFYMDDVLNFSDSLVKLEEYTSEILHHLPENDLFVNVRKCTFHVEEIEFLGFKIKRGSMAIHPKKVSGLKEWLIPTKLKELQSFLGAASYC